MSLGGRTGWIRVRQSTRRHALTVELAPELGRAIPTVLTRVRRLFDLGAEPQRIAQRLGTLAARQPGIAAARRVRWFRGRDARGAWTADQREGGHNACRSLRCSLRRAGGDAISRIAAAHAHCAARRLRHANRTCENRRHLGAGAHACRSPGDGANPNLLDPGADVERGDCRASRRLPGIGEWTAQYLAMRAFAWPDAFPATDLGIRKALGTDDERKILAHAEAWRPWRGYAAMHLWRTLA